MSRALAMVLAGLLMAPSCAFAASWEHYAYPDDGFAVQAPAPLTIAKGQFKTPMGLSGPQTVYTARQDDIVMQVTVDDLRGTSVDKQTALDMAVKQLAAEGAITLNVEARIDAQFGRNLTIADKDGGRSVAAVFFVNGKLYELVGKALPPDPSSGSGKAVRFQESLELIGLGAEANRPENRADGQGRGAGGPGGPRRGPPPPQAFEACNGKALGDQVQLTTPRGVVPASCIQTPQGLAARPQRPPPGGPDGPPPN
ncbi:MAG TPA: hypothetical protein VG960_02370 [Caulobacteraceae bacterium]|nr:hypothetical protein [Caulobacteraceae bacterium]